MAGDVRVGGATAVKPAMMVPEDAQVEIITPMPFVGRGGYKLDGALEVFAINVERKTCADVGACTGGFTDVLLQRGARRVYAIDVGYGQLDWKLRQDERVVPVERTNARYLESLPELINFAAIDVSFISLALIIPAVRKWLSSEFDIVALIKPQFEAGPRDVAKGGIVRDPEVHRRVITNFIEWTYSQGLALAGLIRSPIKGAGGNVDVLAWLRCPEVSSLDVENDILTA
jgi:23S rRNA (cytidine1920-2'-O)/16S rRNA (cytidine1409-2'-O)-methyltransferase